MTQDELSERFVAEEDKFVLRQSKKKADIRVRERRAKPIDFLAFNLRFVDGDRDTFDDDDADVSIKVPTPEMVLEAATEVQLKDLLEDIKSFKTLEKNKSNREYWQALRVLCGEYLEKARAQNHEERLIGSVASDIDKILSPKSLAQLEALEVQINAKLRSDEPIDTDYWEQLLKRLHICKAKELLRKTTEASQEKRLAIMKEGKATDKGKKDDKPAAQEDGLAGGGAMAEDGETVAFDEQEEDEGVGRAGMSESHDPPPGTARFSSMGNEDYSQTTKMLYEREAARGVTEGEEIFAAEEAVPSTAKPKWADKYRPRKPRYFNRVQMGYEWNKYNQTHYDHDNPPPKVVQGYKFNIFYPELIDKTKAPTYRIIREGGRRRGESFAPAGEEDTCLIRFSAGPPYEDIAFRIVDREWDYSAKRERGFKSSYEKGILQLHFQFKKIFYRK